MVVVYFKAPCRYVGCVTSWDPVYKLLLGQTNSLLSFPCSDDGFDPLGRGPPATLEAKNEHPRLRAGWLAFYGRGSKESSSVPWNLQGATRPGLLWRCSTTHSDMLSHICPMNFCILVKPVFVSCNGWTDSWPSHGQRDSLSQLVPPEHRAALLCSESGIMALDALDASHSLLLALFVKTCRILCANCQGMK